jgi:hypothetical protein
MLTETILLKYDVQAEYVGLEIYPFKRGDIVKGTLAFNVEIGIMRLSIPLPDKPIEYTYRDWSKFEADWNIIKRV